MAATLLPMKSELSEPFRSHPARAGIFSDFDGTLSHIVTLPSEARPVPGVREVLAELAAKYACVSIVSGRSAADLVKWLGPDVEIWGVHGAEHARQGRVELSARAAEFEPLMAKVIAEATERVAAAQLAGVIVEDKKVMAGLHFRAAEDVEHARMILDGIAGQLAATYGLTRAGGRLAFELRPPVEFSKAQVVLQRVKEEDLAAAMFLGDDRVDLPAFDALDELASQGVATARVAVASDEAPSELIERADLVLDGPPAVVEFLRTLL